MRGHELLFEIRHERMQPAEQRRISLDVLQSQRFFHLHFGRLFPAVMPADESLVRSGQVRLNALLVVERPDRSWLREASRGCGSPEPLRGVQGVQIIVERLPVRHHVPPEEHVLPVPRPRDRRRDLRVLLQRLLEPQLARGQLLVRHLEAVGPTEALVHLAQEERIPDADPQVGVAAVGTLERDAERVPVRRLNGLVLGRFDHALKTVHAAIELAVGRRALERMGVIVGFDGTEADGTVVVLAFIRVARHRSRTAPSARFIQVTCGNIRRALLIGTSLIVGFM
mmetsp:Transcript_19832/g.42548  ORF Transcript_19832/g.42548 Transcript_19832/m.42548 type:complete len:283 (-) Transcript_19832:1676-2524(-)